MNKKRLFILGVVLALFALVTNAVFADEYDISTGTYTRSDEETRQGFSGNGDSRDNPNAVRLENEGPIPPGTYTLRNLGKTNLGPETIELTPGDDNKMYGRRGFYVHGGTLSQGCIIINDPEFRRSLDGHTLTVD